MSKLDVFSLLLQYRVLLVKNEFYSILSMKRVFLFICCVTFWALTSCNGQSGEKEIEVMLETTKGDIRLKLYNDTPLHRDNFLKNVREGRYDGCTWHRIIRNFMVQTGDPTMSVKGLQDSSLLDSSNWIPAEIHFPTHFHKQGALAAARSDDEENPKRKSDKFQFYIVTGRVFSDAGLVEQQEAQKERAAQRLFEKNVEKYKDELELKRKKRDMQGVSDLLEKILDDARYEVSENPPASFTQEQKRFYRSRGGAPWLDGEYTVFGEVVEGMKTVLDIERVKTDDGDRPLTEVKVLKAYIITE